MRQVEETFCDVLGVRTFSESYLHAFAYLLAPGRFGVRSRQYPSFTRRAKNLSRAAAEFVVPIPTDFDTWFDDAPDPIPKSSEYALLLRVADAAAEAILPDVIATAANLALKAGVPDRSEGRLERVIDGFKLLVPAWGVQHIADILNAAWKIYLDPTFWDHVPKISESRLAVLTELTLKSFEVYEYERLVSAP
jgi:hypothetical protein